MKIVDKENLDEVINHISSGNIAIIPTETVYGIGAKCLDENAVNKIFIAKERTKNNPLNVLIAHKDMVNMVAQNITKIENDLMDKFWPGPFTIILEKKEDVPKVVTAGNNTIGVRMPRNDVTLKIIEKVGMPLAAPSANVSGKPSGTSLYDIQYEFEDRIEYFVDDGISEIGLESTVVRVVNDEILILRPGSITKEDIESLGYKCNIKESNMKSDKLKHYTPLSKCILVDSNGRNNEYLKINEMIQNEYKDSKIIIVAKEENITKYNNSNILKCINMGSGKDLEEISRNIFHILRKIDEYNVDIVFIEGVSKERIGIAIMNRLIRACSYNIIEI